jgi:hypothetical protein
VSINSHPDNIYLSLFFFITNIKVGNRIHRFCLHNGHDLAYDVNIMTSQQRLSRIVTSTFL